MPHFLRRAFPYLAASLLLGALVWAVSFDKLPPADFSFDNGNEVQTLDSAKATGQPENRVINGLFEGLLRQTPPKGWELLDPQANVEMTAGPGMATHFDLSEDGRVYTFHMRQGAQWSDGSPVTADDFAWSWMRMLHPETASEYAYQLYYVAGAEKYNTSAIEPGDRVEVELADRKDPLQTFPRGTLVRGILREVQKPPEPQLEPAATERDKKNADSAWRKSWLYVVEIKPESGGQVDWQAPGQVRTFWKNAAARHEQCHFVLSDFQSNVGVKAEPDRLVVTLNSRTPYFDELVAFYPLYPVNRRCIETHGSPNWAQPANIVGNGAFTLKFRRIRDRIRLVKNPRYWDAARVRLNVIDAMTVKSETTSLNMYLNDQIQWATIVPPYTIPDLKKDYADQFRSAPLLTTYFYRVNVTRPELADKRVRQALNLALDKQAICERVTRAGEIPAATYVPPGLPGYTAPVGTPRDVERAKQLLAAAGYPGGRGLPTIEILYNDVDAHRTIAETVQQMWKANLGVNTELRGLEWGVYLDSQNRLDYDVSRSGWIADYPDPNTFLDMFVTGNGNNKTGWSNARYDELIRLAAAEPDPARRMEMLREAETILLDEMPIIPMYFYVSKNLVHPSVKGFFNNVQDEHPLKLLEIVPQAQADR